MTTYAAGLMCSEVTMNGKYIDPDTVAAGVDVVTGMPVVIGASGVQAGTITRGELRNGVLRVVVSLPNATIEGDRPAYLVPLFSVDRLVIQPSGFIAVHATLHGASLVSERPFESIGPLRIEE